MGLNSAFKGLKYSKIAVELYKLL